MAENNTRDGTAAPAPAPAQAPAPAPVPASAPEAKSRSLRKKKQKGLRDTNPANMPTKIDSETAESESGREETEEEEAARIEEEKKKDIELLSAYITTIAEKTTYEEANSAFRAIVETAALRMPGASAPEPLSRRRLNERLKESLKVIIPSISQSIIQTREIRPVSGFIADKNSKRICQHEMVRHACMREIVLAVNPPENFWNMYTEELMKQGNSLGIVVNGEEMHAFLVAVDEKSKKIKAKVERLAREGPSKLDKATVQAKKIEKLRHPPSLYDSYVKQAALSRLKEPPGLNQYVIVAYAIEAIGSKYLPSDKFLIVEDFISDRISATKAGLVMTKEMLADFCEKNKQITTRMLESAGTIIVHRPDDADPTKVDEAVKGFLQQHQEDFVSNLKKWGINPEKKK